MNHRLLVLVLGLSQNLIHCLTDLRNPQTHIHTIIATEEQTTRHCKNFEKWLIVANGIGCGFFGGGLLGSIIATYWWAPTSIILGWLICWPIPIGAVIVTAGGLAVAHLVNNS